ncbi:hypothetical protein NW762_009066 [Fusarium torreyae]|uniref:phosphogluconate dehydrogenase (NADP(+)-dependent, decarboxylating) n=1 Tax=Fusarium torreyae TaxID=1237075 RepID=A0A9W8RXF2_9HYPO|nr:hypothetical protein NW762_009066 [Fusarium torreyae]
MSLLFAEKGCEGYCYDISRENMDSAEKTIKDVEKQDRVVRKNGYKGLCSNAQSKDHPGVIIFSHPHGVPGDKCVGVRPYITNGDVILDCQNKYHVNTERRHKKAHRRQHLLCGMRCFRRLSKRTSWSIHVSWRRPRSIENLDAVSEDRPGGPVHYMKIVHNGIKQGMMSVISQVWYILTKGLELSDEEAASVFEKWNHSHELFSTFLIYITVDINRTKDLEGHYVLGRIQDKVVQDFDNTEGTGTWSCEEAVRLHVPAATILSAHLFRCSSAELNKRVAGEKASGHRIQPTAMKVESKDDFMEDLRKSTSFCFLLCFTQGLQIIREMDQQRDWKINYPELLQVWGAGSIIQAGGIMKLLRQVYSQPDSQKNNLLSNIELAKELASIFPFLKRSVIAALQPDMLIPAMSQSMEFYNYSTSVGLPTQLTEAELGYFGYHKFNLKEEHKGEPIKGMHHFEWKPAKGASDKSRL